MPSTTTISSTQRPTLGVVNAPASAVVRIDGQVLGTVAEMDGVNSVVRIEEGLHRIEILVGDAVVHREQVYVAGDERKIIDVGVGGVR